MIGRSPLMRRSLSDQRNVKIGSVKEQLQTENYNDSQKKMNFSDELFITTNQLSSEILVISKKEIYLDNG